MDCDPDTHVTEYIGPTAPTSWPAGPLTAVKSCTRSTGPDNVDCHAFIPPRTVVTGCVRATAEDIRRDGFMRVTACSHISRNQSKHANIWNNVVGVSMEGIPAVDVSSNLDFPIITYGPAVVTYPYKELQYHDSQKESGASSVKIGDLIFAEIDKSAPFKVRGDPPGFSRIKLSASKPTAAPRNDSVMLVGRLIAWSTAECEAQITVYMAGPGQTGNIAGAAVNPVVEGPQGEDDDDDDDDDDETGGFSDQLGGTRAGFADTLSRETKAVIMEHLMPAEGGLSNADAHALLKNVGRVCAESGSAPTHASYLNVESTDLTGSEDTTPTGLNFCKSGVNVEQTFGDAHSTPTPAHVLIGSIPTALSDDMTCRDNSDKVKAYMKGWQAYLTGSGSRAEWEKVQSAFPAGSDGVFLRRQDPGGTKMESIDIQANQIPQEIARTMSPIVIMNPTDKNGVGLLDHHAMQSEFKLNSAPSCDENKARKKVRALFAELNKGGGKQPPPSLWSTGHHNICASLISEIAL